MKEFKFKIDGVQYNANVDAKEEGKVEVTLNGKTYTVEVEGAAPKAAPVKPVVAPKPAAAPAAAAPVAAPKAAAPTGAGKVVESPLPGTITKINVKVGDAVKAGDTLLVMEAMKMANDIAAEWDGTVKAVLVSEGASVMNGDALVEIA